MKTLIKNGTILTTTGEIKADILVDGEQIAAIGKDLQGPFDKEIDAAGKYVFPGGVDNHAHFEALNTDGKTTNAGYETTWCTLLGGTTTIVDFCTNEPGMSLCESIDYRINTRAKGRVSPDFALHACCVDYRGEESLAEVEKLVEMGVPTMKLFLAYKGTALYMDDTKLLAFMKEARKHGMTMMVHAENPDVLDDARDSAAAEGHYEPKYHYMTRPQWGEAESVSKAVRFATATGCPLCVVHVSCEEAGEVIKEARAKGAPVMGETCPHYLVLDPHLMDNPDWKQAVHWICSPPLREEPDREYLWKALNNDTLSILGSDNSSIPQYQKEWGFDEELGCVDFRKVPNGCPGAPDRLNVCWSYGVAKGKMTKEKFVEINMEYPAKVNGLYPRKGTIQVGSDADIVIFDPEYRGTWSLESNPNGLTYQPYEGCEQIGRAETVLLRGKVVVDDAKYVGQPGDGQFIPGKPYGMAYDLLEK
ncbi:MAG: dihydropyrimidinase [Clostridia bacterium]|nr:dihydropyrimidinase [Clostridia bacterium]